MYLLKYWSKSNHKNGICFLIETKQFLLFIMFYHWKMDQIQNYFQNTLCWSKYSPNLECQTASPNPWLSRRPWTIWVWRSGWSGIWAERSGNEGSGIYVSFTHANIWYIFCRNIIQALLLPKQMKSQWDPIRLSFFFLLLCVTSQQPLSCTLP